MFFLPCLNGYCKTLVKLYMQIKNRKKNVFFKIFRVWLSTRILNFVADSTSVTIFSEFVSIIFLRVIKGVFYYVAFLVDECFSYLEILCWEIFLVNLPILSYKMFCLPLSCTCHFLKLLFCFDWINQFYFLRVCVLLCVCIFIGSHLIFWIPELHLITMVILVQSLISSVW